jgi:protein-tyrosine-phosphatase
MINPKAVAAMKERGYDLSTHSSKSLSEIPEGPYDCVVGMGCGDACPWIPAKKRLDWDIPDPKGMDEKEFRGVRDVIERMVKELVDELI